MIPLIGDVVSGIGDKGVEFMGRVVARGSTGWVVVRLDNNREVRVKPSKASELIVIERCTMAPVRQAYEHWAYRGHGTIAVIDDTPREVGR
jgi:hypothetical protein